ncbi:MAG: chromate transporter [Bacilli bacterium]|nr:chromate transporter [Bacilli bacterium]
MIFIRLFLVFFMIGLFTIGGGYAMLPMIVDQVVGEGWLTFEALNSFIGIAESTPGPFAVNTATLVGFQVGFDNFGYVGALFGAVFTTLGVVLPSFLIILVIAKHFNNFMKVSWVKDALTGIKAIVVGLIFAVVLKLLITNVIGSITEVKFDLFALIIVVVIFTLKLVFKKLSPILLIVLSGLLGILFYFIF